MMMKTTTLPSPQTWRTTSATAVNPYKQQSTLQSVGGNDVKEETWQMGKQTMDNGY
jgi:hypothetical protein